MVRFTSSWRIRWHMLALLTLLLLSACEIEPEPQPPHLPKRGFTLVLPIYNEAMLTYALTTLKPHLRDEDRFMIVSGNQNGPINPGWINRAALALHRAYPYTDLYAATSGIGNVRRGVAGIDPLVEALVYIYEPNFANQPEFSWDFGETLSRFSEARTVVRQGDLRIIGKPTGRPLLQPSLTDYAWDYSVLADTVDELLIQTQTYCQDSAATFARALDEVSAQYAARGQSRLWLPQITIDPVAPNGTSIAQAQACFSEAYERGLEGTVLWWSPSYVDRVVTFMRDLNISLEP